MLSHKRSIIDSVVYRWQPIEMDDFDFMWDMAYMCVRNETACPCCGGVAWDALMDDKNVFGDWLTVSICDVCLLAGTHTYIYSAEKGVAGNEE